MHGLMILIIFTVIGGGLAQISGLPLPGSIFGMMLLLALLIIMRRTPTILADSVHSLTPYMPLFIVPASVGLVTQTDLLMEHGVALLIILAVSIVPGALVCAAIMLRGKRSS